MQPTSIIKVVAMVLIIEKVNMEGLGIGNQMGHDTSKSAAKMNDCGSSRSTGSYTSSNDNRIDKGANQHLWTVT